jgi:hypothetical protein
MKAYSMDLREKIVESVKKGVPKSETARRFGVHRATGEALLVSNSTSAVPYSRGRLPARPPSSTRKR